MAEQQTAGTGEQGGGTGIGSQIFLGALAVLTGLIAILFGSAASSRPSMDWTLAGGALAFGLVSAFFVLLLSLTGGMRRDERRLAERRAADPGRPWMWSEEWREGRFRSSETRTGAVVVLLFALVWDAVTVGGMWVLEARGAWQPGTVTWAVLFTGAGLFLTGYAVYGLLQRWKYGQAMFQMETVPGVLGGRMKGYVQVPQPVVPGAAAAVSIRCERIWKMGKSSTIDRLWEDRAHVVVPGSRSVPVDFTIPFDLPASDAPGSSPVNPVRWRVAVNAAMPGVDYEAVFAEVPVFATEASDPSIARGAVDSSAATDRPPDAKTTVVEDNAARTVFRLPPVKGVTVTLAIVVLLPVVTWLIARSAAGDEPMVVAMATAIAALAGLGILALLCLAVALTPVGIEIEGDRIDVPHGIWPVRWTRTIPIADVVEVKYATRQVGGSVEARTAGKTYTIGALQQVDEAKWLAAEVGRAVERHQPAGATVAAHVL